MRINVYSYADAEKFFLRNTSLRRNWISIRDIGYEHLYETLDKTCSNILPLFFDDVTRFTVHNKIIHPFYVRAQSKRDLIYFDEGFARKIIDFSGKVYDSGETLNIHCWAGKSRSQAIGYCLNTYYNLFLENNEEDYYENLQQSMDDYLGNFDVVRILTKELYQC